MGGDREGRRKSEIKKGESDREREEERKRDGRGTETPKDREKKGNDLEMKRNFDDPVRILGRYLEILLSSVCGSAFRESLSFVKCIAKQWRIALRVNTSRHRK